MSELSDALYEVQGELAVDAAEFFPNTCDVISVGDPDTGGYGDETGTETTLVSGLPCKYKAMTSPMQKQIGGGSITTLTHVITMPANAITKVIRQHHRIEIQALNDQPELVFRNPVTLDGSFSVFVEVAAELAE